MNANENWEQRLKKKPSDLKLLSVDEQTETLCEIAVKKNPKMFKYVLRPTDELTTFAISKKGENLQYVPLANRKLGWCQLAVKQNGLALEFVPEEHKNPQLFQQAIEQTGKALKFIPPAFQTEPLVLKALENNIEACLHIENWSETIALTVVERSGNLLASVPALFRTDRVIQQAIQNTPSAIRHLHHPTIDQIRLAVSLDGLVLRKLVESEELDFSGEVRKKNEWLTEDICQLAVKQNGLALEHIPVRCHQESLYQLAIQQNGLALQYVPLHLRTPELCDLAFEQDVESIRYHIEPTLEQLEKAVEITPDGVIRHSTLLTTSVLLKALYQKPSLWKRLKNKPVPAIKRLKARDWLALGRLGIPIPPRKLKEYEGDDEFLWLALTTPSLDIETLLSLKKPINNPQFYRFFHRLWEWPEVRWCSQCYIEKIVSQLSDESERFNDYIKDFNQQSSVLQSFIQELREKNEESLVSFGSDMLSDVSVCIGGVRVHGLDLAFVPPQHRSYRLCRLAVQKDPRASLFSPYEI